MAAFNHPPEIAELIKKYDGVIWSAEQAAGCSRGYFSRVARGDKYTDIIRARVLAALEAPKDETLGKEVAPMTKKKTPTEKAPLELPESCPPLLAELIRFKGSKAAAAKALGTSEGSLYKRVDGKLVVPSEWIIKAKVAMGQPVIGVAAQPEAPAAEPEGPPFEPWDGKTTASFKTQPSGPHKPRVIKNVPKPLVDLLNKFDGHMGNAARSVGLAANNSLLSWMENPKKFKEDKQRRVHAVLNDLPLPGDSNGAMSQDYDKYELGIAIVFTSAAGNAFDRINEIADILNGRLAFKRNTKSGWIFMYKMGIDELPRFKKLVARDASDVVCP